MSNFLEILLCNTTNMGICRAGCNSMVDCLPRVGVDTRKFDDGWFPYGNIKSTYVILFYLIVVPTVFACLFCCWKSYERACEDCDDRESNKNSKREKTVPNYKLKYECCKKNVAPILFPIPQDFDFKHHCGQNCLGPHRVQQPRYI